jgi:hypothetical protein
MMDDKNELYQLQTNEVYFLGSLNNKNYSLTRKNISSLIESLNANPDSQRLKFLLANEYLIVNETEKSLKFFDELIDANYYAQVCLRRIIEKFSIEKNPLLPKYTSLYAKKFPGGCLVGLESHLIGEGEGGLQGLDKKCACSPFQKDSIVAKISSARLYLNKRDFKHSDSLVQIYLNLKKPILLDSTMMFERGEYYDIHLRSLFLQKEYGKLREFVNNGLTTNSVITIDNEEQLRQYLQKLYVDYISPSLSGFEAFYNDNFRKAGIT